MGMGGGASPRREHRHQLGFINPACPALACPAIGQQFRQATRMLGADQVELAGILSSPVGPGTAALNSSYAVLFADAARQAQETS
jgi:hypothetical protein